jgi:hypothetical protein
LVSIVLGPDTVLAAAAGLCGWSAVRCAWARSGDSSGCVQPLPPPATNWRTGTRIPHIRHDVTYPAPRPRCGRTRRRMLLMWQEQFIKTYQGRSRRPARVSRHRGWLVNHFPVWHPRKPQSTPLTRLSSTSAARAGRLRPGPAGMYPALDATRTAGHVPAWRRETGHCETTAPQGIVHLPGRDASQHARSGQVTLASRRPGHVGQPPARSCWPPQPASSCRCT